MSYYSEVQYIDDRGCNRHVNCERAEKEWFLLHPGEKYIPSNFHCHDEECDECFGN